GGGADPPASRSLNCAGRLDAWSSARRSRASAPVRQAVEVGEPDLHERPYRVLEPRLVRDAESLVVGLAHLLRSDTLLQPVVPGHEQFLDACTRVVAHGRSVSPLLP